MRIVGVIVKCRHIAMLAFQFGPRERAGGRQNLVRIRTGRIESTIDTDVTALARSDAFPHPTHGRGHVVN